jgi:hypothetical protein
MTGRLKVLILGGYGTFGGRLARLLADEPRLTLVIAGRSHAKAKASCDALRGQAAALPLAFDRDGDVEHQLRAAQPAVVVDASGPFQAYGDSYGVVRACLALGIHYLDLADGSDFVQGIGRFDAEARTRDLFVLAGVSSFPVLTAAVVRHLSVGMARVESVTAGIAPSPFAAVGLNVIRAIAGYAGKPVEIGPGVRRPALIDARRFTIAPPGRLPLDPIHFSLVDVPDIKLLPELWPTLRSVWVGAGPVPEFLHRALNAAAWLVRLKLPSSLSFLAPLMHWATNALASGEHRGGMFVVVEDVAADGTPTQQSWHLVAEGEDGPFIPSMAAEAIIRNCLDGRRPAAGARPAVTELELSDYDASFARCQIFAGGREPMPASMPLYRRLLGEAWHALPEPLRRMHDISDVLVAQGVARVDRGTGLLARLIAATFRFPRAGHDIPITVTFRAGAGREIWQRDFAGRWMQSVQQAGRGRFERLLHERFGPFGFGLALVTEPGRLRFVVRRWTLFGLPLPRGLAPRGDAFESVDDGRFNFHVEIGHPLTGLIVRYRGWLVPNA